MKAIIIRKGKVIGMKEQIFEFVNQYATWGILVAGLLAVFMLCRMHGQLKKLNRSLNSMTGKIQEYFTAITEEPQPEPQPISTREEQRGQRFLVKEEGKKEINSEDEAVIHAVLKEYFS